jgi:hypothetical protein
MEVVVRVLFATDGGSAASSAAHLLEKIGNRDTSDVTIMAVAGSIVRHGG